MTRQAAPAKSCASCGGSGFIRTPTGKVWTCPDCPGPAHRVQGNRAARMLPSRRRRQ